MYHLLKTVEQLKEAIKHDVVNSPDVKRLDAPLGTVMIFSSSRGYLFATQLFSYGANRFWNGTGDSIYYRHQPYVVLECEGGQWKLTVNDVVVEDNYTLWVNDL